MTSTIATVVATFTQHLPHSSSTSWTHRDPNPNFKTQPQIFIFAPLGFRSSKRWRFGQNLHKDAQMPTTPSPTLSMHDVNPKQGRVINFLHSLTPPSSICPPDSEPDRNNNIQGRPCMLRSREPHIPYWFFPGFRVAQVKVIFKLPSLSDPCLHSLWSKHLAYVEWFFHFQAMPDPNHSLHKVMCDPWPGHWHGAVILVSTIHQSIQLFPYFHGSQCVGWTSDNVLDNCDTFFINSLQNRQTYLRMS